jgi:hypothetical protein
MLQNHSCVSLVAHHSNRVEIWLHTLHKQLSAIGFSKKCKQIQAGEIPEASDQESDPPAESDPSFPYEDIDMLAEDSFNEASLNKGPSSQPATNPITNRQVHVEDMPDEDDPDFSNNDSRSHMEDELDSEVIYYQEFPNAGKVYRTDGEVHHAYLKLGQHPDNPFHPFASQLDWEVAHWANKDGPGQAAFTRLLNVDGVSYQLYQQ